MTNYPDWYISKIEQFVNVGFFNKADSKSIGTIAQMIIEESEKSYFGNILDLQDNPDLEKILVSYDHKKVWFVEDRLNYGSSQEDKYNFYVDVFTRLSAISEGIFNPENIKTEECGYCDGRDRRLTVSFQLNGNLFNVNFCIDGTVLVLSFLEEINEFLTPQKGSFEYIFDVYGTGFIFFLTPNQKEYLSRELKWKFNENPGYWLDRAQYCRDREDNHHAEKYFEKAIESPVKGDYPFAISQYGAFLEEQNKQDRAGEVYKKGIEYLKLSGDLDGKQKWWLSVIEDHLIQLRKHQKG